MNNILNWKKGDIFIVVLESNKMFGGCLMIIDEIKSWGVLCFMKVPNEGYAYYRCEFSDMQSIRERKG